jgi:hypothetical protein
LFHENRNWVVPVTLGGRQQKLLHTERDQAEWRALRALHRRVVIGDGNAATAAPADARSGEAQSCEGRGRENAPVASCGRILAFLVKHLKRPSTIHLKPSGATRLPGVGRPWVLPGGCRCRGSRRPATAC